MNKELNVGIFYCQQLHLLTARFKIMMVVEATEKHQLPEAPISFTIMAFYEGFQVLITRRTGEQPILSQVPGVVALINKLVLRLEEGAKHQVELFCVPNEPGDVDRALGFSRENNIGIG